MRLFILALSAIFLLTACQAKIGVSNGLTSKGYINRSEVALGNVYLWQRDGGGTVRVNFVDPEKHPLTPRRPAKDETVTLTRGIEFQGGSELDAQQIADLTFEVRNRSGIDAKAISTIGFRDPLKALLEEIRADRPAWHASLELDEATLTHPDGAIVVLVSEVTRGRQLTLEVDTNAAAGATFEAESVRKGSGKVEFKIVDTNKIDIVTTDAAGVPLFARLIPYVPSRGSNGVKFRTVKDSTVVLDLAKTLAAGI